MPGIGSLIRELDVKIVRNLIKANKLLLSKTSSRVLSLNTKTIYYRATNVLKLTRNRSAHNARLSVFMRTLSTVPRRMSAIGQSVLGAFALYPREHMRAHTWREMGPRGGHDGGLEP